MFKYVHMMPQSKVRVCACAERALGPVSAHSDKVQSHCLEASVELARDDRARSAR
jgi:hypothetical protein